MSIGHPRPSRVVVVGCGSWGEKIATRIIQNDVPLDLVGVVDTSHARAEYVAHRVGVAWFGALGAALDATGADGVVIATPPDTHRVLAIAAMHLGVRNVRVEKPLALTMRDAAAISRTASVLNARVQVGHTSIAAPEVEVLRGLVGKSARGFKSIRFSGSGARHDVSAWWDLGSHDVAMALHLGVSSDCRSVVAGYGGVRCAALVVEGDCGIVRYDASSRQISWTGGVIDASGEPDPLGCELRAFAEGVENLQFGVRVVDILATYAS